MVVRPLHHPRRNPSIRKRLLGVAAFAVAVASLALSGGSASAREVRSARSGQVVFTFNVPQMHDLGIDIEIAGTTRARDEDIYIEHPQWAFPIRAGSDLRFVTEHGIALPGGDVTGSIFIDGSITLRDRASGKTTRFVDLEIGRIAEPSTREEDQGETAPLFLRSAGSKLVFVDLIQSMFDFRPKDNVLRVHYLNARISSAWARAIGRPELAGWVLGMGEIRAASELVSTSPDLKPAYVPKFAGGLKDVSLSALSSIQSVGHAGTFPTGQVALSMSTTSCNVGEVDVPWLAPMQEDHPLIHMAIYRLMNGRFEQIGVSWMKHGFFALSNPGCTGPCMNPSDGSYLAVSCNDTYGVSNNQDRNYLGPREEVNPYTGTWTCSGSHFSGGVADCLRRHGSGGHGVLDHRLIANDADLANAGATYYYEGWYIVRGDESPNNWASRACTMSWNGTAWQFTTPTTGNAIRPDAALTRWGDQSTQFNVAADDGEALLAVTTTDLGGGIFHYEYALLNRNSDRQIRSFSIPVEGVANITNVGFHDNDGAGANDWASEVKNGKITWEMQADPNGEALEFGYMNNFRFDADAAPADVDITMGLFKPGVGTEVSTPSRGPTNVVVSVGDPSVGMPRLVAIRPNPFNRSASISYSLGAPGAMKLEIYDSAGRRIKTLVEETGTAGVHNVSWDGTGEGGARVAAGVYHARLQAGSITTSKSVVMTN